MRYHHTQTGALHFLLIAVSISAGVAAVSFLPGEPTSAVILLGMAVLMAVLATSFRQLTVEDQGEYLRIRFGPLPLFGTRVSYSSMTAAIEGKTLLIDGWGIHYVPWRGWTYNLWGFDCVVIRFGKRVIRVGSDDAARLAHFLSARISATSPENRNESRGIR